MQLGKLFQVSATLAGAVMGFFLAAEVDVGIHLEMPVWIVLPYMIVTLLGFPAAGGFLFWKGSRWVINKLDRKQDG